jgi:hypothetical protein
MMRRSSRRFTAGVALVVSLVAVTHVVAMASWAPSSGSVSSETFGLSLLQTGDSPLLDVESVRVSLGAKLLGLVPLLHAQLAFSSIAIEAGLGWIRGALVYEAVVRYRVPALIDHLWSYAGLGLVRVSGMTFGIEVVTGFEGDIQPLIDLPIELFGGAQLSYFGAGFGTDWHFGVRWRL